MKYNIARRQAKVLDIITPNIGAHGYKVQWATNFDQSFTDIITTSRNGHRDHHLVPAVLGMVAGNWVRIAFDPTKYNIDDTKAFWIKLIQIDDNGDPVDTSPPRLVLPPFKYMGITVVSGLAPNAASVDDALMLELGDSFTGFRVHNESTEAALYVSMDGNTETKVDKDTARTLANLNEAQAVVKVRGGGKDVAFSITLSPTSPR